MHNALREGLPQQLRSLRLERDVTGESRTHIGLLHRLRGARVEVAASCVDRLVVPGLAAARLTVMERDEPDLRIGAQQPAEMREKRGRHSAAPADADAGATQRRPWPPVLDAAWRIVECQRSSVTCFHD